MEKMDAEGVAQMAVITSAFSFSYARQHDEAGWVASAACGTMPLVAFLAKQGSEEGSYLEGSDAAAIWLWFSLVFVVCFCITMVSVKPRGVHESDMDRLLTNTMSLLFTGVTSAHVVLCLSTCSISVIYLACAVHVSSSVSVVILRQLNVGDVQSRLAPCLLLCTAAACGVISRRTLVSSLLAVCVSIGLQLTPGSKPKGRHAVGVIVSSIYVGMTALYFCHKLL